MNISALGCAIVLLTGVAAVPSAQHPGMPAGMTHDAHLAQMEKERELKQRGAAAMGFDQDSATHHFRLSPTGGDIEVATNDAADSAGRDQIRMHLRNIAADFASGNFAAPFATHGEVPPGVTTMQARKNTLTFTYQDRAHGGAVRLRTTDARTRQAVHEFLRYQIREHATGDPLTVAKR
jgi:hypothetical protein